MLLAEMYLGAAESETLQGLVVVKNGNLIAEGYFNGADVDQVSTRWSATKSFTSALVGLALEEGCLTGVDQKMMEFFPEYALDIDDPRKEQITIRNMLEMRSGYPWEENEAPYFDILFLNDTWNNWHWVPHLVDFPLTVDPGTDFTYSSLTSHLLAVVVARACDTDLIPFAKEHLFSPIDATLHDWSTDADGYRVGWGEIQLTARDMARFGQLYLNDGEYKGNQVIPADWVDASLTRYSEGINVSGWLPFQSRYASFTDLGYGYQWWSATVGNHQFDYASGHGGNLIILLDDLEMIIVTTAEALDAGEETWPHQKAILDMVGRFIESLPKERSTR